MRARRVAALWLPGLPLQAVGRDDPAMRERPVAITDGTVVRARNLRAVAAGVAVGMTVAEAATHAPDLTLAPDAPRRTQALWDVVLDHLDTLGPVVEDAGPGLALVDLTGTGRGERSLVRRTLQSLTTFLGLTARAAVADGPFVASVAARRATQDLTVIPRDRGAAFLAPLPVAVLPLPERAVADLALLGVRTVGGFGGLRLSDVQRRYGVAGMAAFTLAIGKDDRPLVPRARERRETLAYPFDPPVDDVSPVLFITKALLDNHAAILRREGLVAGGLRLILTIEGREPVTVEQRWGAACIPGAAEFDALRLTLADRLTGESEDGMLPPRVEELRVTLLDCVPDRGAQLPLFGADTVRQREAVAHLLVRLHALLGPMGVVEDVPVAAHAPEERWRSRPFDAARIGPPSAALAVAESPAIPTIPGMVRVRPPECASVEWTGEQVTALGIGPIHVTVLAVLGPYRVAGRWWEEGCRARSYWLFVTTDQTLHLLTEDHATGNWARIGVVD
jgi:protein ImuB